MSGGGGGQTVGCVKGLRWMAATAGGHRTVTNSSTNKHQRVVSVDGDPCSKVGSPIDKFCVLHSFFFALKVRNWTKMGKNGQKKLPAQIFCAKKIFIFAHLHIADFFVFCSFAPLGLARTDDSFPGCQIAWKVWWGVNPKGCGVGAPLSTHNGTW